MWQRCYDTSNAAVPSAGKGQLFTSISFIQLEFHPFLTTFSAAPSAWIHFACPLTCVVFVSGKSYLRAVCLGLRSWAGRASCSKPLRDPVLDTLLKFSPFHPWNPNHAAHPAFSHTCSWLHPHNTTAQERATHSLISWKERPVCLSVYLSSVWTPAVPQSASRKQILLRLPFPSQH